MEYERSKESAFDLHSSKIESIKIPIIKGSGESTNNDKLFYIKRERLHNKLKRWLESTQKNGVYLVSGYRGMGKTCFINNVLDDIKCDIFIQDKHNFKKKIYTASHLILCACYIILFHNMIWKTLEYIQIPIIGIRIENNMDNLIKSIIKIDLFSPIIQLNIFSYILFLLIISTLFIIFIYIVILPFPHGTSAPKISIKLNLGPEILKERDILALIANLLHKKYSIYKSYLRYKYPYIEALKTLLISFTCVLLTKAIFSHITDLSNNAFLSILIYTPMYFITWNMYSIFAHYLSDMIQEFKHIPTNILNDLALLNERINSVVNEEKSVNIRIKKYIWEKKRGCTYPLADVREIEQELTSILDNISNSQLFKSDFIFVFDELDKIDHTSSTDEDKEAELIPEYENVTSGFPGGNTSRKRKQDILNLLANMKYFISTAKAKFIFVSGREIYDASLSDVSDREFAISSVFNGVIYLDSFLSSENNMKDVSSMTEKFICKHLMSTDDIKDTKLKYHLEKAEKTKDNKYKRKIKIKDDDYSFRTYNQYLHKELENIKKEYNTEIKETDLAYIQQQIMLLYHFSIYLTYVSNGAPKKIASYFEKYIYNDKHQSYLRFRYRDQQKINFIHYMAYPVIQAIINTSGNFGDKLLLSGAFLTDHIYKHHKDGFSWRNIELVPELLDSNKTPELRSFINSIIAFLKQTHLSVIYSGVYTFRFPRRISEEISILSKVSEEISAIFNFTSEETLSVKRYYAKLLKYYSDEKSYYPTATTAELCIHNRTIANIHHILADLYLSEEDFTNAIFEYQKCASILAVNNTTLAQTTPSILLFYVRNMLKLGLAYEKRKTFDSAYYIYQELISSLVKYRYFDETTYKLKYNKEKDHVIINHQSEIKREKVLEHLINNYLPESSDTISKLSLFEDVRFIYQPLLAKLLVSEKMEYCGVTRNKMEEVEEDFNFLGRMINKDERFFIVANFYREMGDIMYYKNGMLNSTMITTEDDDKKDAEKKKKKEETSPIKAWNLWGYNIENAIEAYFNNTPEIIIRYKDEKASIRKVVIRYFKNIDEFQLLYKFTNPKPEIEIDTFLININTPKYIKEKAIKAIEEIIENYIKPKSKNSTKTELEEEKNSRLIFKKAKDCHDRRKQCPFNNNYYPCYACKFYNKSLRIIMKNILPTKQVESNATKSLILWDYLSNRETTPREDTLILIANILNAFGSVMISCSYSFNSNSTPHRENDIISFDFLDSFFKAIEIGYSNFPTQTQDHQNKGNILECFKQYETQEKQLSFIEKGILYFWVASEYYSSSNSKEAFSCYEKVLQIFLNYLIVKKEYYKNFIYHLNDIKKYIVDSAILYMYSNYDKINIAEIDKLKWIFSIKRTEKIPLNLLSHFPDIENIFTAYYELCTELQNIISQDDSEIVHTSSYIGMLNESIQVCNSPRFTKYHLESTVTARANSLHLKERFNYLEIKGLLGITLEESDKFEYAMCNLQKRRAKRSRFKLLQFLIKDSLFCLSTIIEKITSVKDITLFSQSYIADIYYKIYLWNKLYIYIFEYFKSSDKAWNEDIKKFFDELEKENATESKVCFLNTNYSAEMAINHYHKATELHSEGKTYKEFISNLHIQNDDLNNNTFQFQFAIERYLINSGYINKQSEKLKKEFQKSELYKIENYIE